MLEVKCRVVGLHSLFLDGLEGTEAERHVVFCDLDRVPHHRDPAEEPTAFKEALRRVMHRHQVADAYLFRTLKGVHVIAPTLMSRREAERFEEALEDWGSDGFHRFMGYKNGGTVMRVTAKPGESGGPKFVGHVTAAVSDPRPYSGAHFDFLNDLHNGHLPVPRGERAASTEELRFEEYDTVARIPHTQGRLEVAQ